MQAASAQSLEDRVRRSVRETLGLEVKAVDVLHEGLGTRAFYRVHTADRAGRAGGAGGTPASLVARVERPEDPAGRPAGVAPEPALEPLRSFLAEHGIPVPLRFGGEEGIDLLEDLGSRSLGVAVREAPPEERAALYEEACDLVVRLQKAGLGQRGPDAPPAFRRHMDRALFRYKAELFIEWSLPTALGRAPRPAEREAVREGFEAVARAAEAAPRRLAHRDLQSSNLYVRDERRPGHRLAVIDFQGALLAPPEYDLVCLLRDSYVELDDAELERLLRRARPRLPDRPDAATFRRRFDWLTLTRKGKDHARFLYAARTRGDRRFLRFVPATVRALHAAAARAADDDARVARLAELVSRLPEAPCGP